MIARPSKRPDYSLQRNSQKRGLYIRSLLFPMVVLFSIAYNVYQLAPSQKSKFSLHLKKLGTSKFGVHYNVLNSYYTVLIDIFLYCFCLTICFVVSIHNLQSGLQVLEALVEVNTESFSIRNILFFVQDTSRNISQSTESAVPGTVKIRSSEGDHASKAKNQINNTTTFNGSPNDIDKSEVNYFENDGTKVS